MKVKLIGIVVLAVLMFSVVGTALEAVNQVANEDTADSRLTRDELTGRSAVENPTPDDHAVVATLKYVCPFH